MKKRIFSGMQPSGRLHIGNYLGALKNWVLLLDSYECIFCIVDYHAITVEYNPREMRSRIIEAAMDYIASGLDPTRCAIFIQSEIPEHTELAWIFNSVTSMGFLERMTQFKEKSSQHKKNVNVGLFTYPVLQAADILLYKAQAVPVGEDQAQHIEFTREIAARFNYRYGNIFPEPQTLLSEAARVLGLDGEHKMSKSMGNDIALTDSPQIVWEKLSTAKTDTQRVRRSDPGRPDLCNIFSYHRFFSSEEEVETVRIECQKAGIGCFDCKKLLAKNLQETLAPIQSDRSKLEKDVDMVWDVLHEGAKALAPIAQDTMHEVRSAMGLR